MTMLDCVAINRHVQNSRILDFGIVALKSMFSSCSMLARAI
jgi:hypothetical protein